MRLATITTTAGPRLHVRARSGYVDLAEATGNPRFASARSFLEDGRGRLGRRPAGRGG